MCSFSVKENDSWLVLYKCVQWAFNSLDGLAVFDATGIIAGTE